MGAPRWLRFVERPFPSSNMVVIAGDEQVLVDTGYGSDLARTEGLLAESGIGPADLSLVVNTHHHSDHVGGNAGLQGRYGLPVAAHRWEAQMVNSRDPEACSAHWLDQPIEPYRVDVWLSEGDQIDAGGVRLEVLHTPGHTLGHLSLWEPEERVLILGDAAHADDVAWINPYREGAGAIGRAMESVERLAGLKARWACSGHGPAIVEPERALDAARERYEGWLERPESAAWHACKRIAAYALMIRDGLPEARSLRDTSPMNDAGAGTGQGRIGP
jgi:hydroxyacylglutathione hydrolase